MTWPVPPPGAPDSYARWVSDDEPEPAASASWVLDPAEAPTSSGAWVPDATVPAVAAPDPWARPPEPAPAASAVWSGAAEPAAPTSPFADGQDWTRAPDSWTPSARPAYGWADQPTVPMQLPPLQPYLQAPAYPAAPAWTPPTAAELTWATAAHWLPLVSHWIGPLVVLLTHGRRSDRVRTEAVACLNWEITVALMLGLSAALTPLGVIGPALALAVIVLSIGLHVLGALSVARGGTFSYPLALPIVR